MATFKEVKDNAYKSKSLREHAETLEAGTLKDSFLFHADLLYRNKRQEHLDQVTPEISQFLGYSA